MRLFVTHPVQKNLFMSSYAMNFLAAATVGWTYMERRDEVKFLLYMCTCP